MSAMSIPAELAEIVGEIDFDPDALHAKYLAERDKRLREDGASQYVEVKAEYSHYVDDPYVEPGFTRDPVTDAVEFAIIGGGFGGLLMGARLREAGFESIRMVENAQAQIFLRARDPRAQPQHRPPLPAL
jgi:cyclohexanone monooxygenase